jgi:hypothetical protein
MGYKDVMEVYDDSATDPLAGFREEGKEWEAARIEKLRAATSRGSSEQTPSGRSE